MPKEIAKKLKHLGFYYPCIKGVKDDEVLTGCGFSITNHGNTHDYALPLWQQAEEWFRNEKGISFFIETYIDQKESHGIITYCIPKINGLSFGKGCYDSFEYAREAAFIRMIQLVKDTKI